MARKYPDAPSVPAGWLRKALTALRRAVPDRKTRADIGSALSRAHYAEKDAERLAALRACVEMLKSR